MQPLPEKMTPISTTAAPKAIGPYSQALKIEGVSQLVFCSGQIGLDPATGQIVGGGVEAETRCALSNLRAVLGAAGLSMGHVARTTIYLADLRDFETVNRIYQTYFEGHAPARATVGVSALPRGARVEIDAIAVG